MIKYLDGARLRSAMIAACEYAQQSRAELNRINVFPVPDGDTGTNFALTVDAIADRLRLFAEPAIGAVARETAEAAILGARGNCGMILSHFILGFADRVHDRTRLHTREFGEALRAAAEHVYAALDRPVEGTMLTVMREVAEEATQSPCEDFAELLRVLLRRAHASLARTPDLLPVLRKAGVVDAGAKGFVYLLEGIVAYVRGETSSLRPPPPPDSRSPAAAGVEFPSVYERFRFCTEGLVRGAALPAAEQIRAALRDRGDSLVVIRSGDILKVHIHTDAPDEIFSYLRTLGLLVSHKAEDMQVQHETVARAAAAHVSLARRPISIVTDSGCGLPDEVVRAHGIHVVPLTLVYGDRAFRDGVDIRADEFVERLRRGEHATTSQPAPAEFLETYRRAAQEGEAIVAIPLGSTLSGTHASAEAAARRFTDAPVTVVDSRGASLTQGLLVLLAAELAERGMPADALAERLRAVRDRSGIFFTVASFERLLASGRVNRGQVWLANLLGIRPILALDRDGRVIAAAKVRVRRVLPQMLALLERAISPTARDIRFGIIYVGDDGIVKEVAGALRRRFGDREILPAPASPVLATHIGMGAWGIAYQVEA